MSKREHKARMGRPPKPPEERHRFRITVNMTEAEHTRLQAEAEHLGLSISGLLMKPWRSNQRKG